MTRSASSYLTRGALAVLAGIVAIAWPHISVRALVILFAVYVFCDAAGHVQRASASRRVPAAAGYLLLAVLNVTAGLVALFWPAITIFALTIWLAAWALSTGLLQIGAAAVSSGRGGVFRVSLGLIGVASILFGIVVVTHPHAGVMTLALLFGLFLLVYGIDLLVTGARMRIYGEAGPPEALAGGWGWRHARAEQRQERPVTRR
jgi:uncharacterized membrane protein HdeD (DUF308 family)